MTVTDAQSNQHEPSWSRSRWPRFSGRLGFRGERRRRCGLRGFGAAVDRSIRRPRGMRGRLHRALPLRARCSRVLPRRRVRFWLRSGDGGSLWRRLRCLGPRLRAAGAHGTGYRGLKVHPAGAAVRRHWEERLQLLRGPDRMGPARRCCSHLPRHHRVRVLLRQRHPRRTTSRQRQRCGARAVSWTPR